MPIQRFSGVLSRSRIGLVEEEPTPHIKAALRAYDVYRYDDTSSHERGRLATTSAVIFLQSDKRPRQIAEQLMRLAPALLWNGCLVFVQPLVDEPGRGAGRFRRLFVQAIDDLQLPVSGLTADEFGQLGGWVGGINMPKLTPLVHVLESREDWQGVLRYLQLHPPGDAPTPGPQIVLKDSRGIEQELDDEQTLLLQRAFSDSIEVRLERLPDGLSGVDAYRAYVQSKNSLVGGSWPYRYFVKIGARKNVATEYLRYREIALEHLPYHLGPRLRLERCQLGHRSGVLVSDYVSGAEPLRDCARSGRATAAIANLFNVTLRAWHNGARPDDVPLQERLRERLPAKIPGSRKPLIDKCGGKKSLEELSQLLLVGQSRPVTVGVIHGDLHATNVLVRGGDAILIDFEKVETNGPVLRDLACLEAGLFVDSFVADSREPESILESVECLYAPGELLGGRVTPCHPSDGSAWFFDYVTQIRMQARHIELAPGQYALVLASELLRKACAAHEFDANMEQTRALAYVLAERVLTGLSTVSTLKSGE